MGPVLDAPMCADGAAQDLGIVADLAGVVADLLARGPQAGAGILDVGVGSGYVFMPSSA